MFTNQFSASGYLKHFEVDKLLKLFYKEWVVQSKEKEEDLSAKWDQNLEDVSILSGKKNSHGWNLELTMDITKIPSKNFSIIMKKFQL